MEILMRKTPIDRLIQAWYAFKYIIIPNNIIIQDVVSEKITSYGKKYNSNNEEVKKHIISSEDPPKTQSQTTLEKKENNLNGNMKWNDFKHCGGILCMILTKVGCTPY